MPIILALLLTFLGICSASNPESTIWLEENSNKEGVVTLPSGLQYKVLRKGEGESHPAPGSHTECHYEGRLINGDIFASSYEQGEPESFAPILSIPGWGEAMELMVEGDKWEIYLPSELAYGEKGFEPKIKPGDALIFVMEMIEIEQEKVPVVKCNIVSLEECSVKEMTYIEKAKLKFPNMDIVRNEIDRIRRVSQNVSESSKLWAHTRVKILKSFEQQLWLSVV